jgi:membrane-associated protease RseP (regulator of RpoE activity)
MSHSRQKAYIAILAVVAALILVVGYTLRPKSSPVSVISEAERVQLQDLAQRQSLQRRSQMLANYARDLAPRAMQAVRDPGSIPHREPRAGEMLIIVAPAHSGDPLWVTAEFAAAEQATCNGVELPIVATNTVVPNSLAAGAVFTMNDNFVGLVGRCDGRLAIVPPDAFVILRKFSAEQQTMICCGVRFAERREGGESAPLVAELQVGSILDRAGVQPGDRLSNINGNAVSSNDSLRLLLQTPLLKIDVIRGGRVLTLQYQAPSAGNGAELERSPAGTTVRGVAAGTIAEEIGLKPGDVVLRAGESRSPLPAAVDKVLASPAGAKLVVLRGDRRVLLEAAQ